MAKGLWLNRRLVETPYYFRLCLSEKDFKRELSRLKIHPINFVNIGADATTHFFETADGKYCAIVCLQESPRISIVEIYGLLIHEATHIWQYSCDIIGERVPGKEIEAYAVQSISQELIHSYNKQRRIKIKR